MKRLLMISYPFPPNASAGAVRSERFARYLAKDGWEVEVVTIKQRKDLFEDSKRLTGLDNVHFTSTLDPWLWLQTRKSRFLPLRVVRIVLMRVFSFPDHMMLWVPFAIREGLKISKIESVDAIYTTSPPHSSHLAGIILAKLLRKPWVADFRDPWTLNAYRGNGGMERLLLKIERLLEIRILKKASAVLMNTEANRKNLLKAFPFLNESKVVYVPNGWEEFPAEFYQEEEKEGPLTIVHAGTFYPRFKPYALLYALAKWRDGKQDASIPPWNRGIKVVLLGSRDEETKKVLQELKLHDIVEVRPWVAQEEARKVMCQADFLWASLGTNPVSSTYVPSKIFEYIAAGKPIIGFFPLGEAERLIRETGTGVVFTNGDTQPVLRFLEQHIKSPHGSNELKSWYNPNWEVIADYHFSGISSKLAALLEKATAVK